VRVTKHGHACVEVETGQGRLLVDPGTYTEPLDMTGFTAVLVTHEHPDHLDQDRVRAALAADPDLAVWTNLSVAASMADLGDRVHAVGHGDRFDVAGVEVQVHGELHALIHPDIPRIQNIGFRIDGSVFHPGDALTLPGEPLDVLLLPVYAPWSKVGEVIDYVREAGAARTVAVHNAGLSDVGHRLLDALMGPNGPGTGTAYQHLQVGEHLDT
jgi:L-ascorbate metabolism protein UlaG (beta-lactamase superfamily)